MASKFDENPRSVGRRTVRRRLTASTAVRISRLAVVALIAGSGLIAGGRSVSAAPSAGPQCTITTTLRFGSHSADVICLETTLLALGYSGVSGPDESFGASTKRAVIAFQKSKGLAADGVVGRLTATALGLRSNLGSAVPAKVIEARVIANSVQGRPITAYRMGTPGGRVVLIVGVIHGDEVKGALITNLLRTLPTPAGIDLWLIDSVNPDGQANGTRQNANGVDLNRNFEVGWSYIPKSTTNRQYSGDKPGDQPETQAVENFIRTIKPAIGIWYHQDANVISVGGARKVIPLQYAKLVGLGTGSVPCSQQCTGTAGTFANKTVPGSTNFLVELPASSKVTPAMIRIHADALLAVITL